MGKAPTRDWSLESDEALMVSYREGEPGAFDVLYERHSDRIYGYLSRRLSDPVLIDDAFQATFLKFHHLRDRYRAPLPVIRWLFTICRTVMIDAIRQRRRYDGRNRELPEDLASEPPSTVAETPDLPELGTLPTSQRRALELRYQGELTFEEIAARLNTSPENARQLVSRALRRLRRQSDSGGAE